MMTVGVILVLGFVFGGAAGFIIGFFVGRRTAAREIGSGFPVAPPRAPNEQ
jgi:hypothetical protein